MFNKQILAGIVLFTFMLIGSGCYLYDDSGGMTQIEGQAVEVGRNEAGWKVFLYNDNYTIRDPVTGERYEAVLVDHYTVGITKDAKKKWREDRMKRPKEGRFKAPPEDIKVKDIIETR